MKGSLFLLLIGILNQTAYAALPTDFFCSEALPQQSVTYDAGLGGLMPVVVNYGTRVKSCDGKSFSDKNICSMVVPCAFISDPDKAAAKATYGKDFSKLSDVQKRDIMKAEPAFSTGLTCAAHVDPNVGTVTCPIPEKCKGDIYFNIQTVRLDSADVKGNMERVTAGHPDEFQTGSDSTGANAAGAAESAPKAPSP